MDSTYTPCPKKKIHIAYELSGPSHDQIPSLREACIKGLEAFQQWYNENDVARLPESDRGKHLQDTEWYKRGQHIYDCSAYT